MNLVELAKAKGVEAEALAEYGVADLEGGGGCRIEYRDLDGSPARTRIRTSITAKDGSRWSDEEGESDLPIIPYGLWRLPAVEDRKTLFLVEGESDCWAGWAHSMSVIGFPGATQTGKLKADHVEGFKKILAIQEPDIGGKEFIEGLAGQLEKLGWSGEFKIVSLSPHKDLCALHLAAAGNHQNFKSSLKKASDAALTPTLGSPGPGTKKEKKGKKPPPSPPQAFVPFPVDSLPHGLGRFVQDASKSIGCDPVYVALPALSMMAAAIGNTRCVQVKRDWTEPSIIWTTCIGSSGTLKTPAFNTALEPMNKWQQAQFKKHEKELAEYRKQKDLDKERARSRSSECEAGGTGEELVEPVANQIQISDVTVEASALLLQSSPRGVFLSNDELGGWIGGFDAYKPSSRDASEWLKMHTAGPVLINRKTGNNKLIRADRGSCSVTGGIQPRVLANALGGRTEDRREHWDNGLVQRILLAMPPSKIRKFIDYDVPQKVEDKYFEIFTNLIEIPLEEDADGSPQPRALVLSAEAKERFISWVDSNGILMFGESDEVAASFAKIEGYAARLALVIHMIRWAEGDLDLDSEVVDAASMEMGIEIAKWFREEQVRVYDVLTESEEEEVQRKLIELIQAVGGRITASQLTRKMRAYREDIEAAEKALDNLVEAGVGVWKKSPPGTPGRPTRHFHLSEQAVEREAAIVAEHDPEFDPELEPASPDLAPESKPEELSPQPVESSLSEAADPMPTSLPVSTGNIEAPDLPLEHLELVEDTVVETPRPDQTNPRVPPGYKEITL